MSRETPDIRLLFLRVLCLTSIGLGMLCYFLLNPLEYQGLPSFLAFTLGINTVVFITSYARYKAMAKSIFIALNALCYAWLSDLAEGFYLVHFLQMALIAYAIILFRTEESTARNISILFVALLLVSGISSWPMVAPNAEIPAQIVPVSICAGILTFVYGLFLWKISQESPATSLGK